MGAFLSNVVLSRNKYYTYRLPEASQTYESSECKANATYIERISINLHSLLLDFVFALLGFVQVA